jgi:hypothetical protein
MVGSTERIREILEEQLTLSADYHKQNFGAKNGEEFPELARTALASKKFQESIQINAMITMMMMSLGGKENLERLKDPTQASQDPMLNMGMLDALWLGYRLGRQLEHEQTAVLNSIREG